MIELETLVRQLAHQIEKINNSYHRLELETGVAALVSYASKRDDAIDRAITELRATCHTPATNVIDSSSCAAKAIDILEAVK